MITVFHKKTRAKMNSACLIAASNHIFIIKTFLLSTVSRISNHFNFPYLCLYGHERVDSEPKGTHMVLNYALSQRGFVSTKNMEGLECS